MPLTAKTIERLADHLTGTEPFDFPSLLEASLHTDDPGETGANEVKGGKYRRVLMPSWDGKDGKRSPNENVNFTGMPETAVTHIGFWSGDDFLWYHRVHRMEYKAGQTARVPAGGKGLVLALLG